MLMRSLDQLGDEIAELSVHLDAATVRLLDLIREFDIREGWNNGFRSCAAWLAWRVGLDMGAARERVRVARALEKLPRLAEALARGELSYAKVRALTRVATPETEERLLAVGRAGTAEHVERIVRGWRRVDRQAEAQEAKRRHASRALHVYQDVDGTVVIRGRLDARGRRGAHAGADRGARDAPAGQARSRSTPRTFPRKRAHSRSSRPTPWCWSPRPRSTMGSIPAPRASATRSSSMSMPTSWPMPRRPASQSSKAARAFPRKRPSAWRAMPAGWRCATTPMACIVEVGPRTRTIPPALRRALAYRDHGCRFPGCDFAVRPGPPHRALGTGRPTTLSNLVLLCRRHHRAVHEEGFQVERRENGDSSSAGPMALCCRTSRRLRGHERRRGRRSRPEYGGRISAFTRTPPRRGGTASRWTSAGRSMFCIPWRTRCERERAGHAARSPSRTVAEREPSSATRRHERRHG